MFVASHMTYRHRKVKCPLPGAPRQMPARFVRFLLCAPRWSPPAVSVLPPCMSPITYKRYPCCWAISTDSATEGFGMDVADWVARAQVPAGVADESVIGRGHCELCCDCRADVRKAVKPYYSKLNLNV